ncbi:MAG: OmpA family protein [Buchnera aphidicola (Schlechtendalia peitan)]
MKLNKLLKVITLTIPIIAAFSCSFQKDTLDANTYGQNGQMEDTQIDTHVPKQSDFLKKEDVIYFDLNKANINSKFSTVLNDTVTFLYEHPDTNIIIEGHTDKRGTEKYNIELGKRRAYAVKLYLESRGISSKKISIISYGSDKPAEVGDQENSYSKNRRAVIIY